VRNIQIGQHLQSYVTDLFLRFLHLSVVKGTQKEFVDFSRLESLSLEIVKGSNEVTKSHFFISILKNQVVNLSR
jgi:hypothetical protein